MLSARQRYACRALLDLPPSLISLSIFTSGKAITFPLDVAQQMTGTPGVESLLVQYEQGRIYLKH
ncbi:Transaldolase [Enterobacter hormaechei]|nr:fructose-bisphosphate aldolase [Enterobacter hormaechei subsp. oharae]KPR16227.1 fructose-bisphosphate aldolase [Enterobacter hormaechei]KLF93328.1 fructose-bisphosphate aldolase [Enterobacter hormaechei subsp. oharae]KTK12363.1 fructose-bisphosphate aldolase [Enterobacter hormaechei subsp. oharae]KTK19018.1 fructose-bisphosphate aldolase [Enterobacter hormaechei subsp. oharae]